MAILAIIRMTFVPEILPSLVIIGMLLLIFSMGGTQ